MRDFSRIRPSATVCFFVVTIGAAMFFTDPALRIVSLIFGVSGCAFAGLFKRPAADLFAYAVIFLVLTFTNPLFVHRGRTVLFFVNGKAFTLEACIYGADTAVSLICVLLWFRLFSQIMTSEKINSLFARRLSPLGTVFTLALRYVPTFKMRFEEIRSAQKTAGFLSGETFMQRVRSYLNVFFSLAVSSLELSVHTADSMNARGFSLPGHSDIMKKTHTAADIFITVFSIFTAAALILRSISGSVRCTFYPVFRCDTDPVSLIFYAVLCSLPTIFEVKERLKWRCSNVRS